MNTGLTFSASDNSDPNVNGRRYHASYPRAAPAVLVALPYLGAAVLLVVVGSAAWRLATSRAPKGSRRVAVVRAADPFLLLVCVTVAVFAYPQTEILFGIEGNTLAHLRFAKAIAATGVLYPAHFLFEAVTIAAHVLVPTGDWTVSGLIAAFALYLLLAAILWGLVRRALGGCVADGDRYLPPLLAGALSIVAPITMITWPLANLYLGYVVSHQLWSQSMIALKPFAVLAFVLSAAVFRPTRPDRRPLVIVAMALATALATMAKPSFTVCLLPALGLMLVPRILRGRLGDLAIYVGALVLPNVALMLWQFTSTFMRIQRIDDGTPGVGIIFAPLMVMGFYSELYFPGFWWLAPRFLLSVLFPLAVSVLYWPLARQDWRLVLAWAMFAIGCGATYLLAEYQGPYNGNFTWSGQITLFILFVAAMLFLVERIVRPQEHHWKAFVADHRAIACSAILGLHVVAGVYHIVHPLAL